MWMRLIEGRGFDRARRGGGIFEALIDRSLARQFFPTGSVIGAKIPWFTNGGKDVLTVVALSSKHASTTCTKTIGRRCTCAQRISAFAR